MHFSSSLSKLVSTLLMAAAALLPAEASQQQENQSKDESPFQIEICTVPPSLPRIPKVSGTGDYGTGQTVFELLSANTQLTMRGWLVADESELRLRIEIKDAIHLNEQDGAAIWNGDFLRVAIDAWGDGPGRAAKDASGAMGPDDASIGFALTPKGPRGWIYESDSQGPEGAFPRELLDITRDDTAKTTNYRIRFPWKLLRTQPGLTGRLGLCVQIRNVDSPSQSEPEHLRWGAGANNLQTGLFKQLATDFYPKGYSGVSVQSTELWTQLHSVHVALAAQSDSPASIELKAGTANQIVPITPGTEPTRLVIRYKATGTEAPPLQILLPGHSDPILVRPSFPDRELQQLDQRCLALASSAKHPLVARHWRSLRSLLRSEWLRVVALAETNPRQAREFMGFVRRILPALDGPAADEASYLKDGRPLLFLKASTSDGSLQPYVLTLPLGWDPSLSRDQQQAFPLFVELHGAGNPSALSGPTTFLSDKGALDLFGYASSHTYPMLARKGYHVLPHARGNLGYTGYAETDVWDAISDIEANFKTDPDRHYLFGFSMGGAGTWKLATRTPDRWAAVAVLAPALWYRGPLPPDSVASNLVNTPVWMWTGTADELIQQHRHLNSIMTAAGVDLTQSEGAGVGHNYLSSVQIASHDWLLSHVRHVPTKFSFLADTDQHTGSWGVALLRDVNVDTAPSFLCELKPGRIVLTSKGTRRITLDPIRLGIASGTRITVEWNGNRAFDGIPTMPLVLNLP